MADLMCLERIVESRARLDPVIFRDPRILDNMLANESASVVAEDYFETTQKDNHIRAFMRSDIVMWMMEVGAVGRTRAPLTLFLCQMRVIMGGLMWAHIPTWRAQGGGGRVACFAARPPAADHRRRGPTLRNGPRPACTPH
jgi:hypothetical protein